MYHIPDSLEPFKITNQIFLIVKEKEFAIDRIKLAKNGTVTTNCSILLLIPFLDSDGVIRVDGRLTYAKLPYSQNHPILLPAKHELTTLIIEHYHKRQLHPGLQRSIAEVRCRY